MHTNETANIKAILSIPTLSTEYYKPEITLLSWHYKYVTQLSIAVCNFTHPHGSHLERLDTASLMMLHSVTSPNSLKNSRKFSVNQRIKANIP